MCAIEIYGQAVNCILEEIGEVFAITVTFAPYIFFSTAVALVRHFCMNHSKLNVLSPSGSPSCDTQNLFLSELSLFIPLQNIELLFCGSNVMEPPNGSD